MDFSGVIEKVGPAIAKIFCLGDGNRILRTGSGFLYGKKGILVTCDHVVQGGKAVAVRFPGDDPKEVRPAKICLNDVEHDLALLRVEHDQQPLARLPAKEQGNVRPGMQVLFSGYPLDLSALTTHQGILSAIETDEIGVATYLIDGTVNAGNSGCPLMNMKGEVLGVVNATRRERSVLLSKVEGMLVGAVSLHGVDLVEIYQALISNVQLGVGYAVPASYIPDHKHVPFVVSSTPKAKKKPRAKPKRKA